jgi:hypothetical protein
LGLTLLSLAGAELLAMLAAIWPGFFVAPARRVFVRPDAESFRRCLLAVCLPDFRLAWSLPDEFTAALAVGLGVAGIVSTARAGKASAIAQSSTAQDLRNITYPSRSA